MSAPLPPINLYSDTQTRPTEGMRAAIAALKQQQPKRTIVAVPVAAPETCDELKSETDEIICLETPASFSAVGLWYEDFAQVTDEDVRKLLERSEQRDGSKRSGQT